MSRSHDLEETLANVTELVAKRLDADVCSIYTTDADQRELTLSSTIGLDSEAVGKVTMRVGEGLVGVTAERGEPIALEDYEELMDLTGYGMNSCRRLCRGSCRV